MPVLSRFYGIIIRMYFQQSEHNPPHIHAIYGENVAAIDFQEKKSYEATSFKNRSENDSFFSAYHIK